ncbi:hypothetical protein AVEN_225813-1 [Araneus ventricosus]|uniref:RRM domain-containing protein n=1 Tax=Araneus ventricosus TaxID=182803 RepID=A0A4Y2BAA5_ARAVE|nr:hypothetical protein AVEN_225813-1 [Araneus ventricosus]
MPHKIYVGNYPLSFIEDDVLNLFQDYEGVELDVFFRNKNKCYSFLHCISERQLIEIVANLHDIDVCGRNLIVRAADENLQKQIQKSILKYGAVNVHPKNTCDVNSSTSVYGNNGMFVQSEARPSKQSSPQMVNSYSKNTYPKKYEMGTSAGHLTTPNTYNNSKRIAKQNESLSKNREIQDYSSHFSESNYSSQQSSYYAQTSFNGGRGKNTSSYCQNLSEAEGKKSDLCINPQETFLKFSKSKTDASGHHKTIGERFGSFKTFHNRENSTSAGQRPTDLSEEYQTRNRNASESSLETVHNQPRSQDCKSLSFVSVVNFPLYLPTRDLYRLFADFNPIKVFIVCNEPRKDKTPTEAIICFEKEKEATDAILNLDNTVYRGRILIVTDAVDMSLVSELLSFQ